jgi:RND family efflux transporter MFP subunit
MQLRETVDYIGTVRSQKEVKVLARVMGSLTSLPFKEGQRFRAGQILARISVPDLDARERRLAAEVRRAETERRYHCKQLGRDRTLLESGAAPRVKVEASRRLCEGAGEMLKAARASARELGTNRAKADERAPFAGRVLRWIAEPGEHVAPGRPLLLLGDEELEIRVPVSEADVARGIRVGTPALLAPRLPGKERPSAEGSRLERSKVRSMAALATGPGRTIEVRLALSTALRARAVHGTSVAVAFVLAQEGRSLAVPEAAVKSTSSGSTIFVVEEGRTRAVPVKAGITASGWVSVRPAPRPGARVAVTNLDLLEGGMRVYPVEERGLEP